MMQILIVQAQPDGKSLTAAVTNALRRGATAAGHSIEVADLGAEGFDPCEPQPDLDCYHGIGPAPLDVTREQARIDRADALVLVFPIYWWSMPGILKGWVDRVFINGWAFRYERGKVIGTMRNIPVHVVGIGGGNQLGYDKHGYGRSFSTQIEQGIFRFCGIDCVYVHLMLDSESAHTDVRAKHLATAFAIGETLALPARDAT
jgi:NAD(P)H dehydrogenase (quinone)